MGVSRLATQIYPEIGFKGRRGLGRSRDGTPMDGKQHFVCPSAGFDSIAVPIAAAENAATAYNFDDIGMENISYEIPDLGYARRLGMPGDSRAWSALGVSNLGLDSRPSSAHLRVCSIPLARANPS